VKPASDARSPRVAIVDDEEDIATYLEMALEDRGYDVVTTSNPKEAMDLLISSEPDVIFLDVVMPGQTGIAVYAEILGHPRLRECPIVIMSGLAVGAELKGILERAGGLPEPAGVMEKPIGIDELTSMVERLLGRRAGGVT